MEPPRDSPPARNSEAGVRFDPGPVQDPLFERDPAFFDARDVVHVK